MWLWPGPFRMTGMTTGDESGENPDGSASFIKRPLVQIGAVTALAGAIFAAVAGAAARPRLTRTPVRTRWSAAVS